MYNKTIFLDSVFVIFWIINNPVYDFSNTVEPPFNEPLYNEILGMSTNYLLQPGQNYNKMYGTEPSYNDPNLKKSSLQQTQSWNTNVKYTYTCDRKRTKDECEKGY